MKSIIGKAVIVLHLLAIVGLILIAFMEKGIANRMWWFGTMIFVLGFLSIDRTLGNGKSRLALGGRLIILIAATIFIFCIVIVVLSDLDSEAMEGFSLTLPFFLAAYVIAASLYLVDQKISAQHGDKVIQ